MDFAIQESKYWIETLTNKSFNYPNDIRKSLQNGILLCNLINFLKSGSIPKYNKIPTPIAFLDNLSLVQNACISEFGLNYCQVFDIRDLDDPSIRGVFDTEEEIQFEILKKLKNVLITIFWLGKWAQINLPSIVPLKFHAFDTLFNTFKSETLIDEELTEDVSDTASTIDKIVANNTFKSTISTEEEGQNEFNKLINTPEMIALNYDGFRDSKFSLSDFKDNFLNSPFIDNINDVPNRQESSLKFLYSDKLENQDSNSNIDFHITNKVKDNLSNIKNSENILTNFRCKPTVKPKPAYNNLKNKDMTLCNVHKPNFKLNNEIYTLSDNYNDYNVELSNDLTYKRLWTKDANKLRKPAQQNSKTNTDLIEIIDPDNENSFYICNTNENKNTDSNIKTNLFSSETEASSKSLISKDEVPPVINWNTFPVESNINIEGESIQHNYDLHNKIEPSDLYLKFIKEGNINSEKEANNNDLIFANTIFSRSNADIKYIDDNQDYYENIHQLNGLSISQSTLINKKEKMVDVFSCHFSPNLEIINNFDKCSVVNCLSVDHVNQSIVVNNDSKYIYLPLHQNSFKESDSYTESFESSFKNNLTNGNNKYYKNINEPILDNQIKQSILKKENNSDSKNKIFYAEPKTCSDKNEAITFNDKKLNYNKPFVPALKENNLNMRTITFKSSDKDIDNWNHKYSERITEIARVKFLNSMGNCIQLKPSSRKMAFDLNMEARRQFEWSKNYEEKRKKQLEKRQNDIRKSTLEGLKKAKLIEEEKKAQEINNLKLCEFHQKNDDFDENIKKKQSYFERNSNSQKNIEAYYSKPINKSQCDETQNILGINIDKEYSLIDDDDVFLPNFLTEDSQQNQYINYFAENHNMPTIKFVNKEINFLDSPKDVPNNVDPTDFKFFNYILKGKRNGRAAVDKSVTFSFDVKSTVADKEEYAGRNIVKIVSENRINNATIEYIENSSSSSSLSNSSNNLSKSNNIDKCEVFCADKDLHCFDTRKDNRQIGKVYVRRASLEDITGLNIKNRIIYQRFGKNDDVYKSEDTVSENIDNVSNNSLTFVENGLDFSGYVSDNHEMYEIEGMRGSEEMMKRAKSYNDVGFYKL